MGRSLAIPQEYLLRVMNTPLLIAITMTAGHEAFQRRRLQSGLHHLVTQGDLNI